MSIQERIDKLSSYFKGIKLAESYRVIEVNIKKDWTIPLTQFESEEIQFSQKESKQPSIYYTMFYSETKTFDELLDFVEEKVINYNLEIEEKERLLKAKVEELKKVFESKSLDELNNLKFTTEEDSLSLKNVSVGVGGQGVLNNTDKEKVS